MTLLVRTITLIGVVVPGIISLAGYPHSAVNPTEQHPARVVMPPEPLVRRQKPTGCRCSTAVGPDADRR